MNGEFPLFAEAAAAFISLTACLKPDFIVISTVATGTPSDSLILTKLERGDNADEDADCCNNVDGPPARLLVFAGAAANDDGGDFALEGDTSAEPLVPPAAGDEADAADPFSIAGERREENEALMLPMPC